ncbi:hypothetical protein GLOIN_2v1787563 [Rhizophagus clarus]|uniref:Uncharacterized protein n=1 Tax=Rhizophagus clarus TaxID=94130 RepID=A0A8H3M3K6_9GLOM|nr:hypothetical protein GLOIN_2v1787563 [Rhizophagus clarus]
MQSKKSRNTIIIQDNNVLNIENDEEIVASEESDEDISRYFSDDDNDVKETNNQISNLKRFTNISEEDINQLEIKENVIGKSGWYKPILQSVVLSICAHSKYPSLKELKKGVLSGFLNESRSLKIIQDCKKFYEKKNNNGKNLFEKKIISDIFKSKDYTLTKSDKLFAVDIIKLAIEGKTVSEENICQKVRNLKI